MNWIMGGLVAWPVTAALLAVAVGRIIKYVQRKDGE